MADLDPDDPRLDIHLEAIRARAAYVSEGDPGSGVLVWRVVDEDVPALLGLIGRLRAERDGSGT